MDANLNQENLLGLTVDVVTAYVSNNPVPKGELATLISDVHSSLGKIGIAEAKVESVTLTPAVSVKKSVTPDYIICLEDGQKFKSLKRHIGVHYNMTPAEYRNKWGLPSDYPMVAPAYAAARSQLAKTMGLGRKKAPPPAPAPVKARGKRAAAPATA